MVLDSQEFFARTLILLSTIRTKSFFKSASTARGKYFLKCVSTKIFVIVYLFLLEKISKCASSCRKNILSAQVLFEIKFLSVYLLLDGKKIAKCVCTIGRKKLLSVYLPLDEKKLLSAYLLSEKNC